MQLTELGLNSSESTIYMQLLQIGSCKAGRLAKETRLNRTTVYKALESLIQKGLVSFVIRENRKYFEPAHPDNILKNIEAEEAEIKNKKEHYKKMLPGLKTLFQQNKEELESKVFKGQKGLKTVFNDIVKTLDEDDEYLAFGVPELAQQFWGYFEEFNKQLKKNRVNCRIIIDERAVKNIKSCRKYGYEVKTLSKEFISPAEVNIFKDKVAIVLWSKTPLAFVIKNKETAQSFTNYFNLLWKIAKL